MPVASVVARLRGREPLLQVAHQRLKSRASSGTGASAAASVFQTTLAEPNQKTPEITTEQMQAILKAGLIQTSLTR